MILIKLGGHFDLDKKKEEIKNLEQELSDSNIWNDPQKMNKINSKLSSLKKSISKYERINSSITDAIGIIDIISDSLKIVDILIPADENDLMELSAEIPELKAEIASLEIETLFTEKYDDNDCFLEIHPGAGGTEACDWASMLLRMYQMFCDKNNYSCEELDYQKGDEAGIKSVTLKISGNHAYGFFKGEQGVHRLVRISPFDSNSRRHTSFAAVSVIPELSQSTTVKIKPEDIRVDVYRSSGKGGQGVNTTDSAVRITHLPTGIVVTCQNERSQIKNKATAMSVLTSKLEKLLEESNEKDIDKLKSHINIEFGSQIRNYTLEPYKLVKDVRTNYETSNADSVLNGDIIEFMKEYLRIKR